MLMKGLPHTVSLCNKPVNSRGDTIVTVELSILEADLEDGTFMAYLCQVR
jgi:hypothetical protein